MEEITKLDMVEIVNWTDKDGNSILHLATFRKQQEIIELLIGQDAAAFGVEINSMNSSGFTPKDIIDVILQSGGKYSDYINILEMFQQAGAVRAREIKTRVPTSPQVEARNINREPTTPPVHSWNLWRQLMKEIEDSSIETQNALMVVAVLIATVTYQAILSPPSGFWSTESRNSHSINSVERRDVLPGEAVMATDPEVFAVFTVFNALGFFASLAMISLLTSGFPLRACLRLAILSIVCPFYDVVIEESGVLPTIKIRRRSVAMV
ncbi:protein binding protein, putative [Ricinus communis]|uniref:Protein binding protein, putative n=1 Tax=Ricinus communis TaxID=3988 RepID=B9SKE5_RICCO|nr:protein binding protein, putative [Ricinus communis]